MNTILELDALAGVIPDGGLIAFGGGGMQRKPMAAAAALARAGLDGIEVAALLGGPEVDLLIGLGLVRRVHYAFVGLDSFGMAPNFRAARQGATIEAVEYSEATMLAALEAAAKALPFLPTRFARDTDLMTIPGTPFRTIACPFTGEPLVAVPALRPDVAIIHVNAADRQGNAVIHSDAFADLSLAQASNRVVLTAERIVDDINAERRPRSTFISRIWVDHVIAAPGGGGMTAVFPDYRFDLPRALDYARRATDTAWLTQQTERTT